MQLSDLAGVDLFASDKHRAEAELAALRTELDSLRAALADSEGTIIVLRQRVQVLEAALDSERAARADALRMYAEEYGRREHGKHQ